MPLTWTIIATVPFVEVVVLRYARSRCHCGLAGRLPAGELFQLAREVVAAGQPALHLAAGRLRDRARLDQDDGVRGDAQLQRDGPPELVDGRPVLFLVAGVGLV